MTTPPCPPSVTLGDKTLLVRTGDLSADSESSFASATTLNFSVDCDCDGTPSPVAPSPPTSPRVPTTGSEATSGIPPRRYVSFAVTIGAGALVLAALAMTV